MTFDILYPTVVVGRAHVSSKQLLKLNGVLSPGQAVMLGRLLLPMRPRWSWSPAIPDESAEFATPWGNRGYAYVVVRGAASAHEGCIEEG